MVVVAAEVAELVNERKRKKKHTMGPKRAFGPHPRCYLYYSPLFLSLGGVWWWWVIRFVLGGS